MQLGVEIMVGRKRKPGKREKNGRAVRTPPRDDRAHAALWPSRSHLKAKDRLSEKASTPLGGLNLHKIITDEEYEAGRRFAGIVMRYRAVIEAPNPSPGGMDRAGMGHMEQDEAERRKADYDAVYERGFDRIESRAMRWAARKWVKDVAVYDQSCPAGVAMEALKLGLSSLAAHFGLTRSRKSAYVGNVK
jgi:hypothetical protein